MRSKRLFHESDDGFTSIGMLVALLLSLSLIFSAAQIYKIQTACARVQDIADMCALSAENTVAQYVRVAQICDASLISLTVTSYICIAAGAVALCVPVTSAFGKELISCGKKILDTRDAFAQKAAAALNVYQRFLPFLALVNAHETARNNVAANTADALHVLVVLVPFSVSEISIASSDNSDFLESLEETEVSIDELAQSCDELYAKAQELLAEAWRFDCGNYEGKCMYERADVLAHVPAICNPMYRSADTWSFAVALSRARAYYAQRAQIEAPSNSSCEEQAQSALRSMYYRFMCEQLAKGYVVESQQNFDVYLPAPPCSLEEFRQTGLYGECCFPVTQFGSSLIAHAYDACAGATGIIGYASLSDIEHGAYSVCEYCQFTPSKIANIAALTSKVESGFEYHYLQVIKCAQAYSEVCSELAPIKKQLELSYDSLFSECLQKIQEAQNVRISLEAPGTRGAIALVFDASPYSESTWFSNAFVDADVSLGTRCAVSGARLLADVSSDKTVIDEYAQRINTLTSGLGVVPSCVLSFWSDLLVGYNTGIAALVDGVESMFGSVSLSEQSGIGKWAAQKLESVLEKLSLNVLDVRVYKAVLCNSAHVASLGDDALCKGYLAVREGALLFDTLATGTLADTLSLVEQEAKEALSSMLDDYRMITITPLGDLGPEIEITLGFPQIDASQSLFDWSAFEDIRAPTFEFGNRWY